MLFQGPNKNACVNRSPKMDIYRGRVGTSRGGPTPPSGKVPHPTPPGASPPRPLRPGQVAGAQGGARALFGGNFGRSSLGREKGWASVSWRSSGWRPVVFYYWEHRAIRVIIISRAALDGFERALSCPERGSNTLLGSFPSLEGGGVARVKGDVSIGNVASRASAGAAPEGIRKGRARVVGGMLPSSSVFRFWDGVL